MRSCLGSIDIGNAWIQTADAGYSIGNAYSNTSAEKFTPRLLARYRSLVEEIYQKGGRKFLFLNVPPTSRTPMFLDKGDQAIKAHAKYLSVFNSNLEAMVKDFTTKHQDVGASTIGVESVS